MKMFHAKGNICVGMTVLFILCTLLGGCSGSREHTASDDTDGFEESVELNKHGDSIYRKEFGTYTVLDGWVESETHSTDEQFFYVKDGHDDDVSPDNISINEGTNRYGKDEYMQFKDAIMAQLLAQVGNQNVQVNGSGTYTANEDPMILFEIIEEDGTVTRQYYIVGDYRYCLVHMTNYSGDEEADRVAEIMADGFAWRE